MKYLVISFLFQLLVVVPCSKVYAGVAEASIGADSIYAQKYDLAGLTAEEKEWFVTFLEGTFYADGWQEIANDIIVMIPPEDRDEQKEILNQLGHKIGREWCKDNDIRKVDTALLKKWGHLLRSTAKEEPHLLAEVLVDIDGELNSLVD